MTDETCAVKFEGSGEVADAAKWNVKHECVDYDTHIIRVTFDVWLFTITVTFSPEQAEMFAREIDNAIAESE